MKIKAYAALREGGLLEPFEYDLGDLKSDEIEIEVEYCGICHGDLSMLRNEWGITSYPFVAGHEIVGRISCIGNNVRHLDIGQYVGLGCRSRSCMFCAQCLTGHHNRCPFGEDVYVGRHGGFAERVRCQALWAFPLPDGINIRSAGPLFCAGITVFSAIFQNDIKSTDHVAVVGMGGLGHMAIKFLNSWGCEITVCSTNLQKEKEARQLGADHFRNSMDLDGLNSLASSFDMVLVTTDAEIDWYAYINALHPGGKLHLVGAGHEVRTDIHPLITDERSIGGSYIGNPSLFPKMLYYCKRHGIEPIVEEFPLSQVNDAIRHLELGKAHYRIVLQNNLE